jgi:dynein heavy chain
VEETGVLGENHQHADQLIISNAKMKQELKEIEDRILLRLSSSEGSPVDDIDLINTLDASKIKSMEIQV